MPFAPAPLGGRVALVTGVSRRIGIGFALTRRLLADGAAVFATGWAAHDAGMPWGADRHEGSSVEALVRGGDRFRYLPADLADPDSPRRLVAGAVEAFGALDIVIANHARSSSQTLAELSSAELDLTWAVNTRATLLLVQAFAGIHDDDRPGGRVLLFTSGQHLGPMADELPYIATKGALHQLTESLADAVADRGITVNCVNPGPVDTGYATGADHAAVARRFPAGRWGQPEDVARLVAWLVSDEAQWITGQVLNSEGGFRR